MPKSANPLEPGIQRCVLASSNPGKSAELSTLLKPLGFEVVTQTSLGVSPAPEPHATFVENALAKARHAAQDTGLPAMADDSGICVPVLAGEPGVYSARFSQMAGGDAGDSANSQHLITRLKAIGELSGADSSCPVYYYCVLVWLRSANDPQPVIADGLWHGAFIEEARGEGGFGYDPHFFVPDLNMTAAQLGSARKNAISHRALAMAELRAKLTAGR